MLVFFIEENLVRAPTRCRFSGVLTRPFLVKKNVRTHLFFKKDKPGKGTYALQIFRSPYQAFLLTRGRALVCFLKEKPGKGTYVLQIFNCPYRVVYKTKKECATHTFFEKLGKGTYALQIFRCPYQAFS